MEYNKKHICKYCKREFKSGQSLGAHIIHCKENPNNYIKKFNEQRVNNINEKNPYEEHKLICPICNSEYIINIRHNQFEQGKYKHTCSRHCASILTNQKIDLKEKNKKISLNSSHYTFIKNKHLENGKWVENTDEYNKEHKIYYKDTIYKKTTCEICNKVFDILPNKSGTYTNTRFCSKDCLIKFYSNFANEHDFGGKNYSKKFHNGKYHGIRCDSSWELAYLVYNLENNIPIKRCDKKFKYEDENHIIRKYTPDFIVNNEIIEIKGYLSYKDSLKIQQNPQVKILFYEDLLDIFSYIKTKYGNKFWEILYDKDK